MYLEKHKFANINGYLLRESYREGGKVKKRTLANLSHLPLQVVESIRMALTNRPMTFSEDVLEQVDCEDTVPWGHVEAVLTAMNKIGMAELIDPEPSQERSIILGLVASRIIKPLSKYSSAVWWKDCSTLGSSLGINDIEYTDVLKAMDWLLPRQALIEKHLADRHLAEGDLAFLDVSSSYYEGAKSIYATKAGHKDDSKEDSELIRFGYSRDKKKGKPQINYSLLCDKHGFPISIEAFPGNTSDTTIFLPTVDKIREQFNIQRLIMVGDRGMISSKDIAILKETPGVDWITALRNVTIRSLLTDGPQKILLLDERDLCEFVAPAEYPGERLCACKNPDLAVKRANTRQSLIQSTIQKLDKIKIRVTAGRLKKESAIALAVGRVVDKNNAKKYFELDFSNNSFNYTLKSDVIELESSLDGVYVIRTSLPKEVLSIEDCVRQYKNLAQVEQAFRSMKTIDLRIRPIYHSLDNRIRTHLFLAMLSYYVELHLRKVWSELTFGDPELDAIKTVRNPVAPAKRSPKAEKKADSLETEVNGATVPVRSFRLLIESLGTISDVKLVLRQPGTNLPGVTVHRRKKVLSPLQARAFDLLQKIPSYPHAG